MALLVPVLLLFSGCEPDAGFMLGGIHVDEPDFKHYIAELKGHGFNTVEITVYAKQGDWDSDNIWYDFPDSNVIHQLKVAQEEEMGVSLILRVALDHAYPRNKFLWHGMIMPKDSLVDSWFQKYEGFVMRYAKEARKYDVESLVIGSEMKELTATTLFDSDSLLFDEYEGFYHWQDKSKNLILRHKEELQQRHLWVRGYDDFKDIESFLEEKGNRNKEWANEVYCVNDTNRLMKVNEKRRKLGQNWRNMIARVREEYSGRVTYAANFDNYHRVDFWDEMDDLGVNAYFRLRSPGGVDSLTHLQEMEQSWTNIFCDLDTFQQKEGLDLPIVFTELGYTFRDKCTMAPWAHDEFSVIEFQDTSELIVWYDQGENREERIQALKALRTCLGKREEGVELRGILYWKLSTFAEHSDIEDFLLHVGKESEDPLILELEGLKRDYYERRN